jgi:hypothetical protein
MGRLLNDHVNRVSCKGNATLGFLLALQAITRPLSGLSVGSHDAELDEDAVASHEAQDMLKLRRITCEYITEFVDCWVARFWLQASGFRFWSNLRRFRFNSATSRPTTKMLASRALR